jgi:transposase
LAVELALWTFVRVEGVEPTNNAAERALRHAAQWRKTSHGTDSEAGSHFVGNILTVVATCRQQGRNVLEFLTQCCEAALRGAPPGSLLPHKIG